MLPKSAWSPGKADRRWWRSRALLRYLVVIALTLAINLAWYLANRQNRRVLLLDLDLQTGDCALALNLEPTPGLREALTNPVRIDNVFLERTVAVHGRAIPGGSPDDQW